MLKRDLMQSLEAWRQADPHKPILLRGARQVGKSWLVREFGKSFSHFVEINFEKQPEPKLFFQQDLDVRTLIDKLSLYTQKIIKPKETLLFFDEIQECERAIIALRYFKEEMPDLHVIAAGSLVDFALETTGVPVGRLSYLFLHPLSFAEFLTGIGRHDLREYVLTQPIDAVFHQQLLEHVKEYFWLGGMPEVVETWVRTHDADRCQDIQGDIINTYQQDFAKYIKRFQLDKLDKVFNAIPTQLGQKFVYKQMDPEMRSNVLKTALHALQKAGVIHIAYHTTAQGLPLAGSRNEKRFKVYFLDIGLAQRLLGVSRRDLLTVPMNVKYLGGIAEQFVAQNYIAGSSAKQSAALYYWHREEKFSNAEVDFVFLKGGDIIPVEVKSGATGSLKSMRLFLEMHQQSPYGLRVSELPFSIHKDLHTIPFYGIEAWLKQ